MKILFVLDTYYPKVDGPASVVSNMVATLNKEGLAQAELLVPFFPNYKDTEDFKIYRCPSIAGPDTYRIATPSSNRMVKNLIKNGNYDLINVHSPFTLGRYVSKLAKKHKIPIVHTVHTLYKSDIKRNVKSRLLQRYMLRYVLKVMNMANCVYTVSEGAALQLVSEYGYKNKVGVIRNASDLNTKLDLTEKVNEITKIHKLNDDLVFLFVGRVVENKNIQFAIRTLKLLKDEGFTAFKLLIIGTGSYVNALNKLAKDCGLEDHVIFTGLVRDRELLSAYYKRADMLLFPSKIDNCSLVVLEAGAFGVPAMVVKDTCTAELIRHGKDGFIVSDNESDWKDHLLKITNDSNKLTSLKNETKKSFNKTWKDIAKEYCELYKNTIESMKN